MVISENILEALKTNPAKDNYSGTQDYTRIDKDAFSKILESANKSFNFNYDNGNANTEDFGAKEDFSSRNQSLTDPVSNYIRGSITGEEQRPQIVSENNDNKSNFRGNSTPDNIQSTTLNQEIGQRNEVTQSQDKNVTDNVDSGNAKNTGVAENTKLDKPKEVKNEEPQDKRVDESKNNKVENKESSTVTDSKKDNNKINQQTVTIDLKLVSTLVNDAKQGVVQHKGCNDEKNTVKQAANEAASVNQGNSKVNQKDNSQEIVSNVKSDNVSQFTDKIKGNSKPEEDVKGKTDKNSQLQQVKTAENNEKNANSKVTSNQDKDLTDKPDLQVKKSVDDSDKQVQIKQSEGEKTNPNEKSSEKPEKPSIKDDLKPAITKLEVNNSSHEQKGSDLNQQNTNQNNSQVDVKIKIMTNPLQETVGVSTKFDLEQTSQVTKGSEITQNKQLSESVMNQVIKKATSEFSENKSQVSIILKPENLGKVEINLVSVKGVVTAQINAENSQVKDILNKGLETLKQNLQDQGVNIGNVVVKVQEPSSSNNNFQFNHEGQKYDQTSQNLGNSNPNLNTSKQSFEQEKKVYHSQNNDNAEFTEEVNQVKPAEDNSTHAGIIDYRV